MKSIHESKQGDIITRIVPSKQYSHTGIRDHRQTFKNSKV